jgi:hypothetical protein
MTFLQRKAVGRLMFVTPPQWDSWVLDSLKGKRVREFISVDMGSKEGDVGVEMRAYHKEDGTINIVECKTTKRTEMTHICGGGRRGYRERMFIREGKS